MDICTCLDVLYVLPFYSVLCVLYLFFFFFQAEDGIRDIGVTGVQTCALPILIEDLSLTKSSEDSKILINFLAKNLCLESRQYLIHFPDIESRRNLA